MARIETTPLEFRNLHPPPVQKEKQPINFSSQSNSPVSAENLLRFRPRVRGKFLYVGEHKLWIRGVTYGTFRPDASGKEFYNPAKVNQDFSQMVRAGINAVRTYTCPPTWLLEIARSYGLYVMVGLPWEQHITFLDDKTMVNGIEGRIRDMVRQIAGHASILCYTIGNEIPAPLVRWYGAKKIENFLKRLTRVVKKEDPDGLVTYVNYPTTEYLQLPFVDFLCFNVYLEKQDRLEAYLYRLQNLAGNRPLVMGELGFDSGRNGDIQQSLMLDSQIRTAFSSGCAGVFVFSWTDEWHRGGCDITDWHFGLTDQNRIAKPALKIVNRAFSQVPFSWDIKWPRISVVVCSYNGARTIGECFAGLRRLDYPDFEVIVINDGSTDQTSSIAKSHGFSVISTGNMGLSSARNTGLKAASGEIIAYIDDDAYPDPHWLRYIAATFLFTDCAGVGGPNIPPPDDGKIADCVANAPGGPLHVLLSDRKAEHIPGCNMAFRKTCLEEIGGFDPQFRTAGDDVDVCWRIQAEGWWLAFNPGAVVWHHRRNKISIYWRQQKGYGKAEALLEQKWPEKYNGLGHLNWNGRIYGQGITQWFGWRKQRIYHGSWGKAPFQSIYERRAGTLESLPLTPEWYLVNLTLALISLLGFTWKPLLSAFPILVISSVIPLFYVVMSVNKASFSNKPERKTAQWGLQALTAFLHIIQPIARLYGRLENGLTPWRKPNGHRFIFPCRKEYVIWRDQWQSHNETLETIEKFLRLKGDPVKCGGEYERWDLEVSGGLIGSMRLNSVIEEHGSGKQLQRFLLQPRCSFWVWIMLSLFAALSIMAGIDHAWIACIILASIALVVGLRTIQECGTAGGAVISGIEQVKGDKI